VNPLQKAREGAGRSWRKVSEGAGGSWRKVSSGTTRTTGWVKGGVTGGFEKTRGGIRERSAGARDRIAGGWDRTGGHLVAAARSNPRIAIAWVVLALLLVAWIAWAVYVTAENGANAGLGVVISWPVLFGALAIIAAPFVGVWWLIQRHRGGGDSAPTIAGASDGAEAPVDPETTTAGTYPG
jgi:hypothetical protein